MAAEPIEEAPAAAPRRPMIVIEVVDALFVGGAAAVVVGCAWFHPGLGVAAAGALAVIYAVLKAR